MHMFVCSIGLIEGVIANVAASAVCEWPLTDYSFALLFLLVVAYQPHAYTCFML